MTRPRRGLWLALLSVAVLAGAGQPPEKKDPQAIYEPRSAPGAGQKFLEKFVGSWEVAKTFHPRTGAPVKQNGECRQTMTHGGRFLVSEFTFQSDQGKSTGTGTIGFEPATGLFTSVWVDSRSTRMSLRQSRDKFNGEEIVLHTVSLGEGEGRKSRTVTRLEDNGNRIVHRQYNQNADGTERLLMELVLKRKAETPLGR
ncbi:MAG: DUF1579 family protein [Gemmataceae bacterium]